MTAGRVTQAGVEALMKVTPPGVVTQAGVEYLHKVGTVLDVTQAGVEYLHRVQPTYLVTQAGVEFLYKHVPCTTSYCQVWTITRTDGEVFRFTSKDTAFTYRGEVYQACDSLVPSASESVSEVDAASNMDLSGAVGPDGITKEALYSGLFDGAHVEAWLVPWQGTGPRKLLIDATFGPLEQTETGFKVEALGDGAKLMQTPIISLLQPGCRWLSGRFGGFGGPFCGKDLTGLAVTGTIDSGNGLRDFTDAARGEPAGYFTRGKVTFTSGLNSGISAEIKEHASGGVFELWPRLPFPILPGVTYSMIPGCTGLHEASGGTNGCEAWDNRRRYGGWLHVPGGDKRNKAADV